MNNNLYNDIYSELDRAMTCYADSQTTKAGNVLKIYGTDFGGEFGKTRDMNGVEMYAIYSDRKNKSGKYNLKGFQIIVTNFEAGYAETFETITEAMEMVADLMDDTHAVEEQARQDEIADTLSNEACALSDEAKALYNEAKEISDKIGTFLHYTDDPDDEHEALINMAMEMREKLYRIKRIREDFLDRADELTGCNCVFGDFMSDDDMTVDGFDLKYTDPDDIFCSLWNVAWQCYDGHPKSCDIFHDILYGFAA